MKFKNRFSKSIKTDDDNDVNDVVIDFFSRLNSVVSIRGWENNKQTKSLKKKMITIEKTLLDNWWNGTQQDLKF